jgi:ATP-dependent helicase/nuclease subunit A
MTAMTEANPIPADILHAQGLATDPGASAWVSANAGSGKTFVLTRRVMRLLLAGVLPSRILCLTFTKAAAAEMSNRIFAELGKWAAMTAGELDNALRDLLGRAPERKESERARILFALALDSPGGLKIQTIHAFCEALLHQFPLEANVSGDFEIIDESRQSELLADARRQVISELEAPTHGKAPDSKLRDAFSTLIELASDAKIETALSEIVAFRDSFSRWTGGDPTAAMKPYWRSLQMNPSITEEELLSDCLQDTVFSESDLAEIAGLAARSSRTTDKQTAGLIQGLLESSNPKERALLKRRIFLTKENIEKETSSILTQSVIKAWSQLDRRIAEEAARTRNLYKRHQQWRILKSSQAIFTLGEAILDRYRRLKRRRGLADFDDLITHAADLLARPDVGPWIQYKLDRGIDHILVDEAQDTSARQWAIINALSADFFAGKGAVERVRTEFAVGDEKQSIFSFQGADPSLFLEQGRKLEKRASTARRRFEYIPLRISFRSAPDILQAVDAVFAIEDNFRGLSSDPGETRTVHEAIRVRDPGEVWIWPLVGKQKAEQRQSWLEPLDHRGQDHPAEILATRIAETIGSWMDRKEKLPGMDRPLRCGDILILVRRRDAFSSAIVRRLKEAGLPIAGADRLRLTEHIAVEDLIALGRIMLMPEDDLSLAAALKSPLFGLDDDDLIALTEGRGEQTLLEHMRLRAGDPSFMQAPAIRAICDRIDRLQQVASKQDAYGFYAHVLSAEGGRREFLSRLGSEAEDVLDAFEQAALDHSRQHGAGLEQFITAIMRNEPEIKREIDMRENEIRVITVHSAKGLEAPVVFLVDPCGPAFRKAHLPAVVELGNEAPGGFLWANGDRKAMPAIASHDSVAEQEAAEEYRRLLYVGMTRAADRLIVCGWHGIAAPNHPHWHSMVSAALFESAQEVPGGEGWNFRIWQSLEARFAQIRRDKPEKAEEPAGLRSDPLPDWLFRVAPTENGPARAITPSRAGLLPARRDDAEPADDHERAAAGFSTAAAAKARERGKLTHLLLQVLPPERPEERRRAGERIVLANRFGVGADEAQTALEEVLKILENPALSDLFGPQSRAEVPIAGRLRTMGIDIDVAGQIDRLAMAQDWVTVCDFKTNIHVPDDASVTPEAYILQLALYRGLLRETFPERKIRCQLLWTRTGRLMEFGEGLLDKAIESMTFS